MAAGGFRNPHDLPVKVCAVCARPFTWRKKWAANWEQVKYCSDACRARARQGLHKEGT